MGKQGFFKAVLFLELFAKDLQLLSDSVTQIQFVVEQVPVRLLQVLREGGMPRERLEAEHALVLLQLYFDAALFCFELWLRLKLQGLAKAGLFAQIGPTLPQMCEHVLLHMLLLFEGLVAAAVWAHELAHVAAHVPVQLALADEVAVRADRALELRCKCRLSS